VCGLDVVVPAATTPPTTTPALEIGCGLAIDPAGDELVVRDPIEIPDVRMLLDATERAALPTTGAGVSIWITLCYQERGIEPNRPVLPDACGASPDCLYGKTREQVCVKATTTPPSAETTCACCSPNAPGTCVLLARIDGLLAGTTAIVATAIHPEVRTRLAGAPGAAISEVSWTHGATFGVADAQSRLGMGANALGLVFAFSSPVIAGETSPQGLVDALLYKTSGAIVSVAGKLTWTLNAAGYATGVRFDSIAPQGVTPESGDRVAIELRGMRLRDTCGAALAMFESWFFVS